MFGPIIYIYIVSILLAPINPKHHNNQECMDAK